MAIYTFRCRKCVQQVVVEHALAEPHPTHHEGCGGELEHVIEPVGVIYRAGGFYATDSRLDRHSDDD